MHVFDNNFTLLILIIILIIINIVIITITQITIHYVRASIIVCRPSLQTDTKALNDNDRDGNAHARKTVSQSNESIHMGEGSRQSSTLSLHMHSLSLCLCICIASVAYMRARWWHATCRRWISHRYWLILLGLLTNHSNVIFSMLLDTYRCYHRNLDFFHVHNM